MTADLVLDLTLAAQWFPHERELPYVLVGVSDEHAKSWADSLGVAVRRCCVSDSLVIEKARQREGIVAV